jgi:hypothetical protein
MEMDVGGPVELDDNESRKSHLNSIVAVSIALLVTFMGVCKVKDDNICQAMQQAQANKIDNWSWYQARNIREEMLRSMGVQMATQAAISGAEAKAAFEKQAAKFAALAAAQEKKKVKLQAEATACDKSYDELNFHDDQFDLSDAALSIAIALMAITSLTQKRWLYFAALVPAFFGVVMGLSGFFEWGLHPNLLAKWLGT